MKAYSKPFLEIIFFQVKENIAAAPIYDYIDCYGNPVTLYDIQMHSWNEGSGVS